MKTLLCGLAFAPFLSASVLAQPGPADLQPAPLQEHQMAASMAEFSALKEDLGNARWIRATASQTNTMAPCAHCDLRIEGRGPSVGQAFGQTPAV